LRRFAAVAHHVEMRHGGIAIAPELLGNSRCPPLKQISSAFTGDSAGEFSIDLEQLLIE
jgi:hypothetical protein